MATAPSQPVTIAPKLTINAAEDDPETDPELSIAGRVLNQDGEGVAGIDIRAELQGQTFVEVSYSISGSLGYYQFYPLSAGDYQLTTQATARYESATLRVRAGVDPADLLVVEYRPLWV